MWQQRRIREHACDSDAYAFFNLLTGPALLDKVESLLPQHRERLFPPTETLAMFLAQAFSADRSCQKAVNDTAIRRLAAILLRARAPCTLHSFRHAVGPPVALPVASGIMVSVTAALDLLHTVFGYPAFRGTQGQFIDHVYAGGDALVPMPLGSGGTSHCATSVPPPNAACATAAQTHRPSAF